MMTQYYVVPFKTLLKQLDIPEGDETVTISLDQIRRMLQMFLAHAPIDEEWYLRTYPDVEHAIANGLTKSAKEHFCTNGYFEGRRPGPVVVDPEFYLAKYADVAEGVEYGDIESAQAHFEQHGFAEGRLPYSV